MASGVAEIAGGIAVLPEQTRRGRAGGCCHAGCGLSGQYPHGRELEGLPEDSGSRALGRLPVQGIFALLTWRGTR